MRRALARLDVTPGVRADRRVPGRAGWRRPALAVWKGDRVAACVAAASVLAKVTRDRIMVELHERFPEYGFAEHKGYVTAGAQRGARRRTGRARSTGSRTSTWPGGCRDDRRVPAAHA